MKTEDYKQLLSEADCLYTAEQVGAALDKMAAAITEKLFDRNPLVLCVLTGAIIPTGYLLTRLDFPLQLDYLHVTRYADTTSGGKLDWLSEQNYSLQGRHVLIVDDILDEGVTLQALVKHCENAEAASVSSAVLVEKCHDRKTGVKADFVGVQTEDRYLFGYGMDYKGYLRNADGIFAVKGL
ncbi:Hypoxanthine-guanine phosphoribosyltransferase [hydrothermal vent metagenome]|uniref:Hypoxanthine-guanine phosphoribosyltransferase n=1 Tax=hydrothermal vent metagenome TaxID=652676 RepID=A0A3B1BIU7_9ZZZZ